MFTIWNDASEGYTQCISDSILKGESLLIIQYHGYIRNPPSRYPALPLLSAAQKPENLNKDSAKKELVEI